MEFVAGVNLEELINLSGPIPWAQAADFALQAAEGLDHAHQHGLVHRDVKLGNLLVDRDGRVKILDFGLALVDSRRDPDADEFSLAMIFGHNCLGTADYIAPEQISDSFSIDRRADVYSLGCTLYVALSGMLPFPTASSTEKLSGHLSKSPKSLAEIAPTVPADLVAIVAKMMAKKPADRYQSMSEVVEALRPFAIRQKVNFDFLKILAQRAKLARRRMAGQIQSLHGSRVGSSLSQSPELPGLHSASTKLLPQAKIDTEVRSHRTERLPKQDDASTFRARAVESADIREEPPSTPSAVGPVLVPLNGGPVVELRKNLIVIGRDYDCDLSLASPLISGKHCELHFDGFEWRILDLGSKNGVQVNGRAASDESLAPGDRISLASQFHFRIEFNVPIRHVSPQTKKWAFYALAGAALAAGCIYAAAYWLMQ